MFPLPFDLNQKPKLTPYHCEIQHTTHDRSYTQHYGLYHCYDVIVLHLIYEVNDYFEGFPVQITGRYLQPLYQVIKSLKRLLHQSKVFQLHLLPLSLLF